ncbi:glycoside hydrolase family protein [Agromyces mangrovi Wang et al. 2018]|uniref:hypothetical protein n=1 Tax=Agromyces mangrovi TaxID=1858653 RepID=UPI00257315EA|nr:hypothetical protein [Agromyces mangrovi]BDZ65642.1 glycosyl hydrolase [Agromyces mangrovi]
MIEPDAAAPGEIYRDPVYDGATDPTVVVDAAGTWWMHYTQRRANHPDPGPGVAWVHGSRIGVATSDDGRHWEYRGTLESTRGGLELREGAPPEVVTETHWAPDVIHDGARWRMYLTEIGGVPTEWAGHARRIVEYVSDDLVHWERRAPLALDSNLVIDAAVAHCPDGLWRLWYKDEAADSVTKVAVSPDLATWQPGGTAIGGRAHEGPYVFALGGRWWMLTDEWRGMAVHHSPDAVAWQRQGGPDDVILGESGPASAGMQIGRHGMVVVRGDEARLYYFTHPWWDGSEIAEADAAHQRRSTVHVARLRVVGDRLVCER